jgi:acyl-CoA dehydrogenase
LEVDEQRQWLERTRAGTAISAFALTEPGSGSDVANSTATARAEGDGYVLSGDKTYISNGGIADIYAFSPAPAKRRARKGCRPSCCPPMRPALTVVERIEVIAPHPLAHLKFQRHARCRPRH